MKNFLFGIEETNVFIQEPPVRENKKDDDEDKNKMSLSFIYDPNDPDNSKKKEGAQYLLPVQGNINEILNVKYDLDVFIEKLR